MAKRTQILITLFGGWFGLHKYLNKQIGMGILYTLTFGLFCIGWIHDVVMVIKKPIVTSSSNINFSKPNLVKWQNLVLRTNYSQLMVNTDQLKNASEVFIEDNVRILNDSLRLVNETLNPDVYFKRIGLVIECYNNLADLEEFYSTGVSPVSKLQTLNESSLLHNFIQRYWFKVVSDAEKLKTEKARDNKKENAKQKLYAYSENIDASNMKYIEELS